MPCPHISRREQSRFTHPGLRIATALETKLYKHEGNLFALPVIRKNQPFVSPACQSSKYLSIRLAVIALVETTQ